RTLDRPDAAHSLVQPLRSAACVACHDAPQRGRGLLVLSSFRDGHSSRGRNAEARRGAICAAYTRARNVSVVPFRGSSTRDRRRMVEAAGRAILADWIVL